MFVGTINFEIKKTTKTILFNEYNSIFKRQTIHIQNYFHFFKINIYLTIY